MVVVAGVWGDSLPPEGHGKAPCKRRSAPGSVDQTGGLRGREEREKKNTFVQTHDSGMSNQKRPREDPEFDMRWRKRSMLHHFRKITLTHSVLPPKTDRKHCRAGVWQTWLGRSLSISPRTLPACQVLGQVEAHISALRAQLKHETIGATTLTDGSGGGCPRSPPAATCPELGGAAGVVGAAAANDADNTAVDGGARDGANAEIAPLSIETRGNYHLSPAPAERSGNEGQLSEQEDMRLNRLLRSSGCSSSTTPTSGERTTASIRHREESPNIRRDTPGLSFTKGQGEPRIDFDSPGRTSASGASCGVSRELFGGSPTPGCGGYGGSWRSRERGTSFEAARGVPTGREEREDDLEDISDGGFHSGCWRRKYVRGEMR